MLGFPSFLRLSNSPPCGWATGCLSVICPRTRGRFHLWVLWLRRWAWGEHLLSSGRCPVPDDVAAGPWALSLPWEALCQLKGSFSNKLQIGSTFLQWNKSSAAFDQHARRLGTRKAAPTPWELPHTREPASPGHPGSRGGPASTCPHWPPQPLLTQRALWARPTKEPSDERASNGPSHAPPGGGGRSNQSGQRNQIIVVETQNKDSSC